MAHKLSESLQNWYSACFNLKLTYKGGAEWWSTFLGHLRDKLWFFILSERVLPGPGNENLWALLLSKHNLNLWNMASETTLGHWKVNFSPSVVRTGPFALNWVFRTKHQIRITQWFVFKRKIDEEGGGQGVIEKFINLRFSVESFSSQQVPSE